MGIRLRQLREARGLTVAQMVGRLGVKDSRYRKWESESAAMPLEYAIHACSVLHCSLDELSGRVHGVRVVPLTCASPRRSCAGRAHVRRFGTR